MFGNGQQVVGYNKMIKQSMLLSQFMQGSMKTRRRSHRRLMDLPRPVRRVHLCLLGTGSVQIHHVRCRNAPNLFCSSCLVQSRSWRPALAAMMPCAVFPLYMDKMCMLQNSSKCCGNTLQGSSKTVCNFKVFMLGQNYELFQACGSNIICHRCFKKQSLEERPHRIPLEHMTKSIAVSMILPDPDKKCELDLKSQKISCQKP